MLVYRLSKSKYIDDLSGIEAAFAGGRWNKKGRSVLYCSEAPALALLEIVVNLPPMFQPDLQLLTLEIPDEKVKSIEKDQLPENWFHYPAPRVLAEIAEENYRNHGILALKVPSALVQKQYNILINPRSSHFSEIKKISTEPFVFDPRLYKR